MYFEKVFFFKQHKDETLRHFEFKRSKCIANCEYESRSLHLAPSQPQIRHPQYEIIYANWSNL